MESLGSPCCSTKVTISEESKGASRDDLRHLFFGPSGFVRRHFLVFDICWGREVLVSEHADLLQSHVAHICSCYIAAQAPSCSGSSHPTHCCVRAQDSVPQSHQLGWRRVEGEEGGWFGRWKWRVESWMEVELVEGGEGGGVEGVGEGGGWRGESGRVEWRVEVVGRRVEGGR